MCTKQGLSALGDYGQFTYICGPLDEMRHLAAMTASSLSNPCGPGRSTTLDVDELSTLLQELQPLWREAQGSVTW